MEVRKLTRDTMKCEIHVEITISQTHSNSRTRHKSIYHVEITICKENTGIVIHIDSFSNLKGCFRIIEWLGLPNVHTTHATRRTRARFF